MGPAVEKRYCLAARLSATDGGTYEGTISQVCGGVGRNHADALTRLGVAVDFISVVGNDANAHFAFRYCSHMNLKHVCQLDDIPTATYLAVNVKGAVNFGIGSIQNTVARISPQLIRSKSDVIAAADYLLVDSNLSVEAIKAAVEIAASNGRPVWFEPTDVKKVGKIFDANCFHLVHTISPNANEFVGLCDAIGLAIPNKDILSDAEATAEFVLRHADQLLQTLDTLVVTLGAHGVVIVRRVEDNGRGRSEVTILPKPTCPSIESVSGGGDCFNAGLLAGRLKGLSWPDTTTLATRCAALSLQSTHPVPPSLSTLALLRNSH
uniref:Carbohydrate kinase PfkB domain-containing protein n=1 Tax=Plectus sambesii TaxID=2011161 RepID=A0A914VY98_9BILA